jgi:hypothetical protein
MKDKIDSQRTLNGTISPPKLKNMKALQEISMNTLYNIVNKSSGKKPLKRRLSISDEEDKEYDD